MNNWYCIERINDIDSPALIVYPQRVAENIHRMVSMIDHVSRLRPHIKTHKTAEGIKMMMSAGISKFKCATIAEAELLGLCEAPDVVLAYQPHGPKVERFIKVIQAFPKTSYACLTDNQESAGKMSEAFAVNNLTVPVYMDLNVGMNRSGIIPGDDVIDLYQFCSTLKGIKPVGLHAYDGHQRNPDFEQRTIDCNKGFEPVLALQQRLTEIGFPLPVIIAGGSPTFPIHATRPVVECSPGTCIFWDKGYSDLCPEQPFEPAVVLLTRVISLPTSNRICLDLGHKSVAAENDIARRVFFPDAPALKPVGQSEEHLVMEAPESHNFKPGDLLYGIPYHICPTVALYERLITVEKGEVTGEWKVLARDRYINL
jgi:D-serine deaminase-like pyridoxal phosphate-dependent protein